MGIAHEKNDNRQAGETDADNVNTQSEPSSLDITTFLRGGNSVMCNATSLGEMKKMVLDEESDDLKEDMNNILAHYAESGDEVGLKLWACLNRPNMECCDYN